MNKIIIIEGQDKTGKDTLIKNLIREFYIQSPISIHSIGTKLTGDDGYFASFYYYSNLFKLITSNDNLFILNRSYLDEYVYAPLYRNYPGEYIFDLEKEYKFDKLNTNLITLIDSSHNRLQREDEDSFTLDYNESTKEMQAFLDVHNKSIIKNKYIIDIAEKSISQVFKEALDFLTKI